VRGARFSLFGAAFLVCAVAAVSAGATQSALAAAGTTGPTGTSGTSGSTDTTSGSTGTTSLGGSITLGPTSGSPVTIATNPVGLSIEYPVLAADLGTGPCPPPALVSTLQALGDPAIRVGGDSGDQTAPAGTPPFSGVTDLPADFWSQLACLESQTHEPFVIGLNLASQMPAWAATMAAGARSAVPANLLSFQLGNEADIDGPSVPWWNATGLAQTLLPFSTYLDDAEAIETQLGPGAVVEGPDFATGRWNSDIPQIAAALSLKTINAHYYPLNACTGFAQATTAALLRPGASEPDDSVLGTLAEAQRIHLPTIISESNSVACRGKAGVSNSPASAVWGLRLVLNAIRLGIESVRFHSSGSSYDPFVVSGETVTTEPLYQALVVAEQLLPVGATVTTLLTPPSMSGVVVSSPDGNTTYIVSNYASSTKDVRVHAKGVTSFVSIRPTTPVLATFHASPQHGALLVAVAPNSVLAITLGSLS
jgi:hypothetical protein